LPVGRGDADPAFGVELARDCGYELLHGQRVPPRPARAAQEFRESPVAPTSLNQPYGTAWDNMGK
jgi:hypothetical protein